MRWVALCLALAVGGCFGPDDDEPASIVGDWFACTEVDCAEIDDDGVRFRADGSWFEIEGDDQAVADDAICVEIETGEGAYSFDGDTLRIDADGMETTYEVELDGDYLTMFDVAASSSDGSMVRNNQMLRRMRTFEADDCGYDDSPQLPGDAP